MSAVDVLFDDPGAPNRWAPGTIPVLATDLPVVEAARRRQLRFDGRDWRCGDRVLPRNAVSRLVGHDLLTVYPTDRGLEAVRAGVVVATTGQQANAVHRERNRGPVKPRPGIALNLTPSTMQRLRRRAEAMGTDPRGVIEAAILAALDPAKVPAVRRPKAPRARQRSDLSIPLSEMFALAWSREAEKRGADPAKFARTVIKKLVGDPDLLREVIGR